MQPLKYLTGYPADTLLKVQAMIQGETLGDYLVKKYPQAHTITTDNALYEYTQTLKNRFMGKTRPLTKVRFDNKIKVIQHALGQHAYISRVQGAQLKTVTEIRIASLFRTTPEPMLKMIVVQNGPL